MKRGTTEEYIGDIAIIDQLYNEIAEWIDRESKKNVVEQRGFIVMYEDRDSKKNVQSWRIITEENDYNTVGYDWITLLGIYQILYEKLKDNGYDVEFCDKYTPKIIIVINRSEKEHTSSEKLSLFRKACRLFEKFKKE